MNFKIQDTFASSEDTSYANFPCLMGLGIRGANANDLMASPTCSFTKYYATGTTVNFYIKYKTKYLFF